MLTGHYDHTLDEKSRLTLPAKFRESFADGIVLAPGLDACVHAYTRTDWERMVEKQLATLDPLSRDDRRLQRFFFASAVEGELDKQGRVMVPASLAGPAKLGKEVVVAGIYDHLEIWDRATWRKELDEVEGSAEHVAERLAQKRN
jgi:MraZ protein